MAKTKYLYSVEEWDKDERFEFESSYHSGDLIAEDAAQDAYWEHDGQESSWPLTFAIYYPGDILAGRYSVDREAIPTFSASKLAS
jgi:hypothetical protein